MKNQAKALTRAIDRQIKNKIECYEEISYNTNTKSADYEKVLSALLKDYLGSRFDFYTRAQIVDAQMQYTNILERGSNEVDVIGTFTTAVPKLS